jgi:hypothetical protein
VGQHEGPCVLSEKVFMHALPECNTPGLINVASLTHSSNPALDLEAARPLGVFARDLANRLAKGPDVPLRVHRRVDAISVELILRFAHDDGACCTGAFAVGIEAVL